MHAQYLVNLDRILNDLNRQVLGMEPPVVCEKLQALYSQLLKVSGSGATFGFPALSRKAQALGQIVQHRLEDKQDFEPEQWRQWVSDVLGLRLLTHQQEDLLTLKRLPEELLLQPKPRGTSVTLIHENQAQAQALVQGLMPFGYQINAFTNPASAQATLLESPADILLVAMHEPTSAIEQLKLSMSQLFTRLGQRLPTIFLAPNNDYLFQLAAAQAHVEVCLSQPIDVPILAGHIEALLHEGEPPMRILIAEDDEDLAEHFRLILQIAGIQTERLGDSSQILATLDSFNPDVLLIDLNTPDASSAELTRIIRYQARWKGLAIIYLSEQDDLVRQILAITSGVDEFLIKPISDLQLIAALQSRALRSRKLATLINQDSLTGLLKHNSIKDRLAQEINRAKRQRQPVSCALLDIDFFKKVNDNWGHPMGDQVIKSLANLMRQRLRQQDSLGRYGGEEFLVVLPECSVLDAQRLIDELREYFSKIVFNAGGKNFQVTLSAGIAVSDSFTNADAMIAAADQALYHAKHSGRNQVCSHTAIP